MPVWCMSNKQARFKNQASNAKALHDIKISLFSKSLYVIKISITKLDPTKEILSEFHIAKKRIIVTKFSHFKLSLPVEKRITIDKV